MIRYWVDQGTPGRSLFIYLDLNFENQLLSRRLHYNRVSGDDSFFGSQVFRYAILSHPRFLIRKPSDRPLSFSLPRTTVHSFYNASCHIKSLSAPGILSSHPPLRIFEKPVIVDSLVQVSLSRDPLDLFYLGILLL